MPAIYSRCSAVHTVIWGKSKCRHIAVRRPCAKLSSSVYRRYFVRKCVCVLKFPAFGRSCSCMSGYWLWAFFYNIILRFAQLKMWIKYYQQSNCGVLCKLLLLLWNQNICRAESVETVLTVKKYTIDKADSDKGDFKGIQSFQENSRKALQPYLAMDIKP